MILFLIPPVQYAVGGTRPVDSEVQRPKRKKYGVIISPLSTILLMAIALPVGFNTSEGSPSISLHRRSLVSIHAFWLAAS